MVRRERDALEQFALGGFTRLNNLLQRRLLAVKPKVTLLFFWTVAVDAAGLKYALDRLGKIHFVLRPAV